MSGASALAAAKRRRAVPTEPVRPSSNYQKPNAEPVKPIQPSVQNQIQTPAQNPLHLLLQHDQKLKDLENSFTQIKIADKPNTLTPDTLQYFKTQHDLMHQELNELKKIIIKVQTFSMETNLEILKLKKLIKTEPVAVESRESFGSNETNELIGSNFTNENIS